MESIPTIHSDSQVGGYNHPCALNSFTMLYLRHQVNMRLKSLLWSRKARAILSPSDVSPKQPSKSAAQSRGPRDHRTSGSSYSLPRVASRNMTRDTGLGRLQSSTQELTKKEENTFFKEFASTVPQTETTCCIILWLGTSSICE